MNEQTLVGFIRLAEYAIKVAESNATWEAKYNIIFSDDVSAILIKQAQIEWYDPDGSYEEDVTAFIDALREHLDEIRKIASAVWKAK